MAKGFGIFNKSKTEVSEDVKEQIIDDENTEKIEGEKIMSQGETKKKYYCMVVDKDGVVILDKKGNPYFCTVEEGTSPKWPDPWPDDVQRIAIIDKDLRVELSEIPANLSKDDKKKAKNEIRANAREKLMELGRYRIEAAKKTESLSVVTMKQEDKKGMDEAITPETIENSGTKAKTVIAVEKENVDIASFLKNAEILGTQINQDISNAVDDILGTIAENDKDIKATVQEQGKNLDVRTKRYIDDSISIIGQKTQKAAEDVSRKVYDTGRNISESQDKIILKVNTVGKRMVDLVESVEGIEGNLTKLDQLDEIVNLLRDKGLNISMEIPPVNAEEEDIINLVRYSQKITEQLGYAARDLIRKRETFKNQAESNENEQKIMSQRIEAARQEGIKEGKLQVVKQLLSKYEDVDAIKDSTENYVHVIWTMLTELGVVIDGDGFYEKGKEIELSDEDIEKMMAIYSKFDGTGKYRVVRTGLSLYGETISVAQFSKVTEEEKQDGDFSNQIDEKQSETESEEPKSDVNQQVGKKH